MNQQQKYIRLAHILTRLKTGEDMGIPELQKSLEALKSTEGVCLECGIKTLQRDIKDLKKMGCPIVYHRSPEHRTYELKDKNWELPSVPLLCESEIFSVVLGSQLAAGILPEYCAGKVTAAAGSIIKANTANFISTPDLGSLKILMPPMSDELSHLFSVLFEAWQTCRCVTISYCDNNGGISQRTIEPQALVFHKMQWYICAFCYLRNAVRTFAVPRITSATLLERTFERHPEYYAELDFDSFDNRETYRNIKIRLTLKGRQEAIANVLHAKQKITSCSDGTYIMTIPEKNIRLATQWVLSLLGEAIPLEPIEFSNEVKKTLAKISNFLNT